jgi:hypothetical protein
MSRGKNLQREDESDGHECQGDDGASLFRGGADHIRAGANEPESRARRARFIKTNPRRIGDLQ